MKLTKAEWQDVPVNQSFLIIWKNKEDIQFGMTQTGIGIEFAFKKDDKRFYTDSKFLCSYHPSFEFDMYLCDEDTRLDCYSTIISLNSRRKNFSIEAGTTVLENIKEFCELLLEYRKGN